MTEKRTPANKGKKYPPEVLTPDEVTRLLKTPSNRAPTGIRNRALLYVGYRSGLRMSEALDLFIKDVETDKGVIRILHGKGDKARTVGMPQDACVALDRWIDKRKQLKIRKSAPLFCTLDGAPLSSPYVRALMKRLKEKASIEKRVHYHGLRHTCAWELAQEGKPMPIIQNALGHTSLQTTDRYLRHVAPIDVIDIMKNR